MNQNLIFKFLFTTLITFCVINTIHGLPTTEETDDDTLYSDLAEEAGEENISSRDSRFLPLFKLYSNFPVPQNTKCTTPEGYDGHCLKRTQCKSINGGTITSSSCAKGFGICCLIKLKWEGTTTGKIKVKHSPSLIVNEGKPSTAFYEIARQPDVCQVRLDFKLFEVQQPVTSKDPEFIDSTPEDGNCETDVFSVIGAQNLDKFSICGTATGQHMYLHYGESQLIKLFLETVSANSKYDIQVTMIKCSSTERAPDDCTQYFTDARGMVKSFNYPNQQLNDQKYSVCVKGDASPIGWAECPGESQPFFISGMAPNISSTSCPGDHIIIPGYINGVTAPVYCGGKFPRIQGLSSKPYTLYVNFDGGEPQLSDLQPNGCPSGFTCAQNDQPIPGMPGEPIIPCELMNGVCGGTCTCMVAPYRQASPELDLKNTGFCLSYTK